ncbi:MAG: VWA domain-containing protein [Pyrinomonadaceae bacterium]
MERFFILLLLFSFGLTFSASAQDKKPDDKDEVIKVDTQLVDVPLAVTSSAGLPLKGLKASNFVVYEDGKKQDISDFAATTAPFEVALVLDTSGSARNDLLLIQRAARDFIASLRPGDRVAVIGFRTDRKENQAFAVSEVLTPLTDDRVKLKAAIDNVKTSNGTPYYDSLLQVAEKIFSQRPADEFRGRRALVALTDGVDSSSAADFSIVKEELGQVGVISFFIQVDTQEYFEDALLGDCQSAIRFSAAQIRRYYKTIASKGKRMEKAVNFCQLGDFERLAISKRLYEIADEEMNDLAKNSGGKVFQVGDLGEARNAFKNVADEIGTKYTLGYYPTNEKKDGTLRKITVEVKGLPAGTVVRARESYTAPGN